MNRSGECANFHMQTTFKIPINTNTAIPVLPTYKMDMRDVLGSMYNKYDKFLLILNSISYQNASSDGVSSPITFTYIGNGDGPVGNNTITTIGISGLNLFSNTNNIQSIGIFPNKHKLSTNNGPNYDNFTSSNGITFMKSQPAITIQMQFYDISYFANPIGAKNTSATDDNIYYSFSFTIYGLFD